MTFKFHIASALSKCIPSQLFPNVAPVFMLHRIASNSEHKTRLNIEHLRWCLEYVRHQKYNPIPLDTLANAYKNNLPLPPKSVVFTIDDGFWDHYEIAGKVFSEYDIPLTCFTICDFLDNLLWPWDDQVRYILSLSKKPSIKLTLPNEREIILDKSLRVAQLTSKIQNELKTMNQDDIYSWFAHFYGAAEVEKPASAPEFYRPMSWENAQLFINQGHSIAPHTCTHRILSQLSDNSAHEEIERSWNILCHRLTGASKNFCYPTGRISDYGEREKLILDKLDFQCAVSTVPMHARTNEGIYDIPRYSLPNEKVNFVQYLSLIEEAKFRIRTTLMPRKKTA